MWNLKDLLDLVIALSSIIMVYVMSTFYHLYACLHISIRSEPDTRTQIAIPSNPQIENTNCTVKNIWLLHTNNITNNYLQKPSN